MCELLLTALSEGPGFACMLANNSHSVPTLPLLSSWFKLSSCQVILNVVRCPLSIIFCFILVLLSAKRLLLKGSSSEAANHLRTDFFWGEKL